MDGGEVGWKISDGTKVVPPGLGTWVFAPDGQSVFAGNGVYRTSDNTFYRAIPNGVNQTIIAAAYSPDGSRIILMPDWSTSPALQAFSWSWSNGTTGASFPGDHIDATFAGVSPDGARVLFGPKMYSLLDGMRVAGYDGFPADHRRRVFARWSFGGFSGRWQRPDSVGLDRGGPADTRGRSEPRYGTRVLAGWDDARQRGPGQQRQGMGGSLRHLALDSRRDQRAHRSDLQRRLVTRQQVRGQYGQRLAGDPVADLGRDD